MFKIKKKLCTYIKIIFLKLNVENTIFMYNCVGLYTKKSAIYY